MVPTWILSAPDGPNVAPTNLAIGGLAVYIPTDYIIDYITSRMAVTETIHLKTSEASFLNTDKLNPHRGKDRHN